MECPLWWSPLLFYISSLESTCLKSFQCFVSSSVIHSMITLFTIIGVEKSFEELHTIFSPIQMHVIIILLSQSIRGADIGIMGLVLRRLGRPCTQDRAVDQGIYHKAGLWFDYWIPANQSVISVPWMMSGDLELNAMVISISCLGTFLCTWHWTLVWGYAILSISDNNKKCNK